jgi:G3E family GTPase
MLPVCVLTGFLGSGKTTILARLLRQQEFARTAVIINEFGDVGLDHELVAASEDSIIELATGCLCCKVRSDLTQTIGELLQRRAQRTCAPFERIVIETSGLADPAPILQTLMTDPTLAGHLALARVVTTADAVSAPGTLEREWVSRKQVALADRIVLTKLDLAAAAERPLRRRLAALNASAPIVRADHGRIDPARLLGADADANSSTHVALLSGLTESAHRHLHAVHDSEIQTYAIMREAPIPAVVMTLFLEALAEHCGADLLRLKGIVNLVESPDRPAVIHGVQHVFHAPSFLERWPGADRRSRIVFIVRHIPQAWSETLLDAILDEVADVSPAVDEFRPAAFTSA